MFKFAWKKPGSQASGQLGISLASDGFSICRITPDENGSPILTLCRSFSGLTTDERQIALTELVAAEKLQDLRCVVVLPSEFYSMRLFDRPNVEDDEIASSLSWLIKDLIDFDTAEAVIDFTCFPSDANRGREEKIFVAAARKSVISELTDLLRAAGLQTVTIDVAEFAMSNLVERMPEQVTGTLLLDLREKDGLLAICHDGSVYFTRSISNGTAQVDDAMGNEISLDGGDDEELSHHVRSLLDELLLELQRSLDYYESELGKAPASRLVIAPSTSEIGPYIPYLAENLRPVHVSQLDLSTLVASEEALTNELQTKSLIALGGALRGESDQQIDLNKAPKILSAYTTLPIEWVAKISALVFVGLMVIYGFGVLRNTQLEAEIEANRVHHDSINRQLTSLESEIAKNSGEGDAFDPLASIRSERRTVANTLRDLDALGGDRGEGFSKFFVGFARQLVEHLWLTRIEVLDGGDSLSIHGNTFAAKGVPRLLRKLRSEPSFEGKSFSLFRVTGSDEPGVLKFSLESVSVEATAP